MPGLPAIPMRGDAVTGGSNWLCARGPDCAGRDWETASGTGWFVYAESVEALQTQVNRRE